MGGARMQEAGVNLIFESSRLSVMGVWELVQRFAAIWSAFRVVKREIRSRRSDLVVLIDSPDFNLRIAKTARRVGIPVIYYIAPKVWAWRPGRIRQIKDRVDRVLLILPFEKELYERSGVSHQYVGNPLLDQIPPSLDRKRLRKQFGLSSDDRVIALLPGSRRFEVARLLPLMLAAVKRTADSEGPLRCLLPVAPAISRREVEEILAPFDLPVTLVAGEAPAVLAASDAALVASGTATLEAALVETPMVVVYQVSAVSFEVAKLLIKVPHVSLVNLIAGREVVPELLQNAATIESVSHHLRRILGDSHARQDMLSGFAEVRRRLGGPGASDRAAEEVIQMLDRTKVAA